MRHSTRTPFFLNLDPEYRNLKNIGYRFMVTICLIISITGNQFQFLIFLKMKTVIGY